MDLTDLLIELTKPTAYPDSPSSVMLHQTHISVVFLAGNRAYKIKKPVDFGFLDFRTLDRRRHFCEEEVRLNRRLAPDIYRNVVPITRTREGRLQIGGTGEIVEWAVEMERLPEEATFLARLNRGTVGQSEVEALARRVTAFHAAAEHSSYIATFGRFDTVATNTRENFAKAVSLFGTALSETVFNRLEKLSDSHLTRLQMLIEARANRGVPCDTHGDLRLEHVYLFPDRKPPRDLAIIDCIEFNERFRYADPVADMAFLVMDLRFHGRDDLALAFADAYFLQSGDNEGRNLLPFYTAYRAAVRGKVEGLQLEEKEFSAEEKAKILRCSRAHWLLALGELDEVDKRPCLVLVMGLPGTGKSALANGLATDAGFKVIRTDTVRKELAGVTGTAKTAGFEEGIYSSEWTDRTYAECQRRAERLLFEGDRVIVDANFRENARRQAFLQSAACLCVPAVILQCRAKPDTVRARLQTRSGDVSDADWSVYQRAAEHWEEPDSATRPFIHELPIDADPKTTRARARAVLQSKGLDDLQ